MNRTDSKVELMDKFVDSFEGSMSSSEIIKIIHSVFGFDLNVIPVSSVYGELRKKPSAIIDSYLDQYKQKVTGPEIREMINQIFGLNLDALFSLEGARISIYSKDQWILQDDHDLFVVHTGACDVDVRILPTKYFTEVTGLVDLPNDLQHSLANFGFYHDKNIGSYYYKTPTGEAVTDDFKGQTIGAIIEVIRNSYSHLL